MSAFATRSALLVLAGAAVAVSAAIGAPSAAADPNTITCEPGQIVIDNQCAAPPDQNAGGTDAGTGAGMGDHGGDSGHGH